MGLLAVIIFASTISVGQSYVNAHYDARIPDRCATFEKSTDATNGNAKFCKAWFIEHHVKDVDK